VTVAQELPAGEASKECRKAPVGGAENQEKENAMTNRNNHRNARTSDTPLTGIDLDAFLIDDEFDDSLDRHVSAIRESLADFRNA
jgi:hypothetical protein